MLKDKNLSSLKLMVLMILFRRKASLQYLKKLQELAPILSGKENGYFVTDIIPE